MLYYHNLKYHIIASMIAVDQILTYRNLDPLYPCSSCYLPLVFHCSTLKIKKLFNDSSSRGDCFKHKKPDFLII